MLEPAAFQENFPPGVPIPAPARALLDFQNAAPGWYSGSFELSTWAYGDPAWFDGDRAAAEQFVVLGCGPDGSHYCLWIYPGRTVEDAPVVFLGSEGTDCGLLANDLREFLALLAVDSDELGFEVSWGAIEPSDPPAERLDEFRDWLRASFGIEPPADPLRAVADARARHPDFDAWLATRRDSSGE